jgi:hypothetical protein
MRCSASVQITRVGITNSIFGMNLVENSTLAGTESRPWIGPITKPRNRSIPVQSPPPATWKKSIAHNLFVAMAAINATSTTPTIGSLTNGTIWKSGRAGGA